MEISYKVTDSNSIGDLTENRQNLIRLLGARCAQLQDRLPPSNGHDHTISNGFDLSHHTNGVAAAPKKTDAQRAQSEIDVELATEARCSIGRVRQARRLARSGNEGRIVAALLGLLPIGTALRGAQPPKSNQRYDRWQRIATLVNGNGR